MAAYGLYRRGRNPRLLLAAGLVAAVAAMVLAHHSSPIASWLLGGGLALAIAGATIAETNGWFPASRSLVALGGASYSLYLIHVPVIGALLKIARANGLATLVPPAGLWWILLLTTVATAWIAWVAVERPLGLAMRNQFGRGS
jgi:peptidoglycan/LPS O-acetylase OafA/YrhL